MITTINLKNAMPNPTIKFKIKQNLDLFLMVVGGVGHDKI
jgi:hypothetical protein